MFHPTISRARAVTTPRVAVLLLASGILAAGFAVPSQAQSDHGHGPPQQYERNYRRDAPRDYHHDDRGPTFYDSAPPVVYAPAPYYAQPGPVLLLNIPLFR
jgi:hypothetical protein